MSDYDSPVEWTNRAHLVTTSCVECGESVSVAADVARAASEGRQAVTCDECTHDCRDHLDGVGSDEIPEGTIRLSCELCGEWWEFDIRSGELRQV